MKSPKSSWGLAPMFEPRGRAVREIPPSGDTPGRGKRAHFFSRAEDESERREDVDDGLLDSRPIEPIEPRQRFPRRERRET